MFWASGNRRIFLEGPPVNPSQVPREPGNCEDLSFCCFKTLFFFWSLCHLHCLGLNLWLAHSGEVSQGAGRLLAKATSMADLVVTFLSLSGAPDPALCSPPPHLATWALHPAANWTQ